MNQTSGQHEFVASNVSKQRASGLKGKREENQVNASDLHALWGQRQTILGLSEADNKKFEAVTAKFEAHFIKKRNVVFQV